MKRMLHNIKTWGLSTAGLSFIIVLLTVLTLGWFYSQCIETQVLGFIQDDGMYTITAKALAQGQGYKLLNVITHPYQVKYPILYPLILALGWLMNPHFPQNIPLLGLLTTAFTVASFFLVFYYFRDCKTLPAWLAYCFVLMTASSFFLIFYGTGLMSEGPYLFFSLLALFYAEKTLLRQPTRRSLILSILLSALAFHTRTIGIALILAVGLMLLFQRQRKAAVQYLAGAFAVTLLPWTLWTSLHAPNLQDPWQSVILRGYTTYAQEFHILSTEGTYLSTFINTFGSFVSRLLESVLPIIPHFFNLHPHSGLDQHKAFLQSYFLFFLIATYGLVGHYLLQLIRAGKEALRGVPAQALSASGLYLTFYCCIVLGWNYETQMARFLCVLLPWLWYYLFKPFLAPVQQKGKKAWPSILLILGLVFLIVEPFPMAYHYIQGLRARHWIDTGKYPMLWSEYQNAMRFIQVQLPDEAPIACEWDKVMYLYTGHPTAQIMDMNLKKKDGEFLASSFPEVLATLRHYGVQYLLVEPDMKAHEVKGPAGLVAKGLLAGYPEQFKWIYTSPYGMLSLYRILPPAEIKPLSRKTTLSR